MRTQRSAIVYILRSRRLFDLAEQADRELPEHVDTVQDADQLRRLGIDPTSRGEGGRLATFD